MEYINYISKNRCEEAQNTIPLEKDETKFIRLYQSSIGYTVSLGLLPATFVLDLLLLGRCQHGGCKEARDIYEFLFPTSTYTYEHTKPFRCPDNSYYISKFLEISKCFETRGDEESLKSALGPVKMLSDQYNQNVTCIQVKDWHKIKATQERLNSKLIHIMANK